MWRHFSLLCLYESLQGTPGAPGALGSTGPPGKQGELGPPVSLSVSESDPGGDAASANERFSCPVWVCTWHRVLCFLSHLWQKLLHEHPGGGRKSCQPGLTESVRQTQRNWECLFAGLTASCPVWMLMGLYDSHTQCLLWTPTFLPSPCSPLVLWLDRCCFISYSKWVLITIL